MLRLISLFQGAYVIKRLAWIFEIKTKSVFYGTFSQVYIQLMDKHTLYV